MDNPGLHFREPGTSTKPHLCDITISPNPCVLKVSLLVFQICSASSYPLHRHIISVSKEITLSSPSHKLPDRDSSPSTLLPYLYPTCTSSPVTVDELPFFLGPVPDHGPYYVIPP